MSPIHTDSSMLCGDRVCSDVIRQYPWVWNRVGRVETRYGTMFIPYAYLSDGSSSVAFDLVPDAFFRHDRLYQYPVVYKDGKGKVRLNRFQCDRVYLDEHLKAAKEETTRTARAIRRMIAWRRYFGLIAGNSLPNSPWAKHRKREARMGDNYQEWLALRYTLPDAPAWDLPTMKTKDARYVPKA